VNSTTLLTRMTEIARALYDDQAKVTAGHGANGYGWEIQVAWPGTTMRYAGTTWGEAVQAALVSLADQAGIQEARARDARERADRAAVGLLTIRDYMRDVKVQVPS